MFLVRSVSRPHPRRAHDHDGEGLRPHSAAHHPLLEGAVARVPGNHAGQVVARHAHACGRENIPRLNEGNGTTDMRRQGLSF